MLLVFIGPEVKR